MKVNYFLYILFFLCQMSFSQTLLKGKVISAASSLDNINVINLSNKRNTVTEKGGFFSILAQANDTLMFSAIQVKGIQVVLKATDFSENLYFVPLKEQITMLDDVYIKNYPEINAVALGIIPKGTKSYTPAQRRLRTATTGGGIVPVDPIINWISGRTAMLKKEVQVENKERLLATLSDLYEDVFFVETLKIPSEYIKGFQIFALDNERLVASIKSKNKTLVTFLLGELAGQYKSMLFPEKN
ncbi:hypothetical protein [Flavobacterium sp.]|uniref:hypothetical protein n=1 Tax=Flavobacterium sp. TaxID=239 RepID=UPI002607CCFB|nr:hypothetical protein [Flavobacterium sp.]